MISKKTMTIQRSKTHGNARGFTLVEMITVLVIAAVVGAVILYRGSGNEGAKAVTEVDRLKAHLRFAQYLALNNISPVRWGIQINGQSYTLVRNLTGDGATFDQPYNLPGENSATHSLAPLSATSVTILFDEWGTPYNRATKLGSNATITLNPGSQSIIVSAGTGFIP